MILYYLQALRGRRGGESASIRFPKSLTHSHPPSTVHGRKITNKLPVLQRPDASPAQLMELGRAPSLWALPHATTVRNATASQADPIRFTLLLLGAPSCRQDGRGQEITSASEGFLNLLGEGANLSHLAHNLLGLQNIPEHTHQTAERK